MAMLVLSTNSWSIIKDRLSDILAAIDAVTPGSYTEVDISGQR
jgi:hypothetical protein